MRAHGNRFDVVVVGAGHNGLVAAAYLGRAGLRVALLEAREVLGGPAGAFEFMPGYRTAFTNSPGSFEPKIIQELDLPAHGLRFVRPDPTLVHHFSDRCFIGWRERARTEQQLDAFSPGEAARYNSLLSDIEKMARSLGISVYEPAPDLDRGRERLSVDERRLFDQVFRGSLRDLLDSRLRSEQAKVLLGMVALNVTLARPSAPGSAVGLMLRPLSLASSPDSGEDDPRRTALRGSTGLPIGGMGAIVDALEASCAHYGVEVRRNTRVASIRDSNDSVTGLVTDSGEEILATAVVSAINPQTTFGMLRAGAVPSKMQEDIAALPMTGSAFKLVLALNRIPRYAGLPEGLSNEMAAATQFRIGTSLDHVEEVIATAQAGRLPERPLVWGLIPTITSPALAPSGRHLLSANVWHAPYRLAQGDWEQSKAWFRDRCIDTLSELMPDLPDCILDSRAMSPKDLERELGLVRSHITHGDMMPDHLFGPRPHALANDYRTPLQGLYLSGSGTWPGGYVTGIPGLNASRTVLADLGRH
jgi:phytoene dehydrogenase-like protein